MFAKVVFALLAMSLVCIAAYYLGQASEASQPASSE